MDEKNETPIKNGKKGLTAILAIIIIAILAGGAYYFLKPKSPKDIFVGGINSTLDASREELAVNSNKLNTTIVLTGNIESNDEDVKEVAKYINDGKITYNVQMDRNSKKLLAGVNLEYKNENLLNGKVIFTGEDDNMYLFVQDLYEKYFKFNMKDAIKDEQELSSFKNIFNEEVSNTENSKKALGIMKNEIAKNLKEEYFSKDTVDGMTKNTMKVTIGEFKEIIKNVATALKNNEEFINCYKNTDETKKSLDSLINVVSETNSDSDSTKMEISLYTKGITDEINKIEVKLSDSQNKEVTITIIETEKNKYEIKADAGDSGKFTLNMEVKNDNNTDLDSIDVSNSVEIDKLSDGDMLKIHGNLMNMKIYNYIAPYFMSSLAY